VLAAGADGTQLEQTREVREGFAKQTTGMAQTTALLTTIARPEEARGSRLAAVAAIGFVQSLAAPVIPAAPSL
jgi:hypothetical protein